MLGFKEMNFASFELKTIKFIKFLKANFQQNIHQFVGILNEDFTGVYVSPCQSILVNVGPQTVRPRRPWQDQSGTEWKSRRSSTN